VVWCLHPCILSGSRSRPKDVLTSIFSFEIQKPTATIPGKLGTIQPPFPLPHVAKPSVGSKNGHAQAG
jgi:hypothetical protein